MLGKWFRMGKEEKNEEKVLYTLKMIVLDIDFQERSVHVTQDNRTRSRTIVAKYH